jgi:hypothetical protein
MYGGDSVAIVRGLGRPVNNFTRHFYDMSLRAETNLLFGLRPKE